jgi:UDP-N-acetylmuramoylalanine--D-glutamate ligase
MSRFLSKRGVPTRIAADLDQAVRTAMAMVVPGDHVVLSPAFSSLDMYGGFDDRGDAFTEAVRILSAEPISI